MTTTRTLHSVSTLTVLAASVLFASGCGGAGIHADVEEPATWRQRFIWLEDRDGQPTLMAVGVVDLPRLHAERAQMLAVQSVQSRVGIFYAALELAVVQVVTRGQVSATQNGSRETPDVLGGVRAHDFTVSQTSAVAATPEVEVINSEYDDDADVLRVIGQVRYSALRRAALASRKLTDEQRRVLSDMSGQGQTLLAQAFSLALDQVAREE